MTFKTASGAEYDVTRKEWGYYATPSTNGRLKRFGWRTALVISPRAAGNRISTEQAGFEHNDFAIITMQFESGVIAKVTGNAGSVAPHFHRVAVYGTEGTFLNELGGATRHRSSDFVNPPERDTKEYPGREKGEIIHSFVDSILKGSDPIVSSGDVFRVMSVCLAAEESMRTGKPVQVEQI